MSQFQVELLAQTDLNILQIISSGPTPILLVNSRSNSKSYILKIFSTYTREKQIHAVLSHPNIIKCLSDDHLLFPVQTVRKDFILLEYAPHGDFFNLVLDYPFNNEKLIRTYFHHLIEGLKYLHSQHIAHLDLKLENLLLSKDFSLKIADFDLAQDIRTTKTPIGWGGTANYRAPEILSGSCESLCAADIYSAGVCLYVLMAGAFPFIEEKIEGSASLFRYDTFLEDNILGRKSRVG